MIDTTPGPIKPASWPPPHDEELCGLDVAGHPPPCPACADPSRASLLAGDLRRIADVFGSADRRAKVSAVTADREQAEAARREAAGDFWAAESALAQLFLMMLHNSTKHEREATRNYLRELLREEFAELAAAVARMEGRR